MAEVGQETSFTGGDAALNFDLSQYLGRNGRKPKAGFQISANGFDIGDATVSVTADGATEPVIVAAPDGAGSSATYGEGFYLSAVEISGLPAGDYKVTILV